MYSMINYYCRVKTFSYLEVGLKSSIKSNTQVASTCKVGHKETTNLSPSGASSPARICRSSPAAACPAPAAAPRSPSRRGVHGSPAPPAAPEPEPLGAPLRPDTRTQSGLWPVQTPARAPPRCRTRPWRWAPPQVCREPPTWRSFLPVPVLFIHTFNIQHGSVTSYNLNTATFFLLR